MKDSLQPGSLLGGPSSKINALYSPQIMLNCLNVEREREREREREDYGEFSEMSLCFVERTMTKGFSI